ncbi:uncharacterized protein IL334_005872 [Kwoniella shivajii]|uniref:C3H1-type domain-containing protein n=1 Tax=Kwoniella shivajii TaxID=564305 RepID=A0ABZ1D4B9_9TREE|nr:hypothetical protein IL334_005872 [Kwoniella shivajii]
MVPPNTYNPSITTFYPEERAPNGSNQAQVRRTSSRHQNKYHHIQTQPSQSASQRQSLDYDEGIISNDDASDVEITLNSSSNLVKYNRGTNDEGLKHQFNKHNKLDNQGGFDGTTYDLGPVHDVTPYSDVRSRPRLVDFGVGAVNRHLNSGTISRESTLTANPFKEPRNHRAMSYAKGFITSPIDETSVTTTSANGSTREPHTGTTLHQHPSQNPATTAQNSIPKASQLLTTPTQTMNYSQSSGQPIMHRNVLPNLNRFASAEYIAAVIATSPPTLDEQDLPITRSFSFASPPYSDQDIPAPIPYNSEYPHPLTAYASPRVNAEVVRKSGFDKLLQHLVETDLPLALGSRLYDAGFRDLESSVYLFFSFEGTQGNGIPESLWSKLESTTSARLPAGQLPLGIAGVSPFVESNLDMPPRFAQIQSNHQATIQHGMLTPPSSVGENDYFPKALVSSGYNHEYDLTPRASSHHHLIRQAASMGHVRYPPHDSEFNQQQYQRSISQTHPQTIPPFTHQQGVNSIPGDFTTISPFFKTELCAAWEQGRHCKYGGQCQYAHGYDELRHAHHPRHVEESSTSSHGAFVLSRNPQIVETYGMVSPSVSRSRSNQPHPRVAAIATHQIHPHPRVEPRRASCPPQQLPTLPEHDHLIPLPSRQQCLTIPAPIGAERPIISTPSSVAIMKSSRSSIETWEDMPPFILAGSSTDSSSLSTSSDSTRSIGMVYSESSAIVGGDAGRRPIQNRDDLALPILSLSAGNSIWR